MSIVHRTNVYIHAQHDGYLRYLADRDDISASKALGLLLDGYKDEAAGSGAPRKVTKRHVCIGPGHLAIIDSLARKWGVSRSYVIRRVIEESNRARACMGQPVD